MSQSRYLPLPLTQTLILGVVLTLSACAPASAPAGGEIGDQVAAALRSGNAKFEHPEWERLLAESVRDGLVDYGSLSRHRDVLDRYLDRIAKAELFRLRPDHLKALLINAYNAYTAVAILGHPGVASIRDIDGVWSKTTHTVGGFEVTLDNIEHNLLRPYFKDPRIHVAVNCASQSCAPLPPWAFDGDRLDAQLDEWTRAFFANSKYARIEGGKLWLSSLLDWYGGDFTAMEARPRADTLAGFVRLSAPPEIASFIDQKGGNPEIAFLEYDWSLNQAPAP